VPESFILALSEHQGLYRKVAQTLWRKLHEFGLESVRFLRNAPLDDLPFPFELDCDSCCLCRVTFSNPKISRMAADFRQSTEIAPLKLPDTSFLRTLSDH
jgi:hypothetical protein